MAPGKPGVGNTMLGKKAVTKKSTDSKVIRPLCSSVALSLPPSEDQVVCGLWQRAPQGHEGHDNSSDHPGITWLLPLSPNLTLWNTLGMSEDLPTKENAQ